MGDPRIPERAHPGGPRRRHELIDRLAGRDARLEVPGHREQLMHRMSPLIARHRAVGAAHGTSECGLVREVAPQAVGDLLRRGRRLAAWAEAPEETLGHDPLERRPDLVRVDAEVGQPGHGGRRVIGVEGRKDQVTRQRRLDRDLRRLPVADLPDQDHIGILSQDRSERGRKGEAGLLVHLHLHDSRQTVLHRILDRDDVDPTRLDGLQDRVEGRRLARAGGTRHQHHPLPRLEERGQRVRLRLEESKRLE